MESQKKELIEYLRTFDIVLFSMFIVFGLVGIATLLFVGIPGIMFIIPAVLSFSYWYSAYCGASTCVVSLEEAGCLDTLLSDFKNGERFLNGRLIKGESFLIVKGSGRVYRTENIARLYEHRKKNGFAGDTLVLMAETQDGKKHELTFLSMKGKDDEDIRRLTQK